MICRYIRILAMAVSILSAAIVSAQTSALEQPVANNFASPRFAYLLSCEGTYVTIDLSQPKVTSDPRSIPGISASPRHACSINSVQSDDARKILYVVLEPEDQDATPFGLVALRLPGFTKLGAADLEAPSYEPKLALTKSGLLLSYRVFGPNGQGTNVWEHYSASSLRKLGKLRGDGKKKILVSHSPYSGRQEEVFDGHRVLGQDGEMVRNVTGEELLTPNIRDQFRALQADEGRLGMMFAQSAGERMIFIVNPEFKYQDPMKVGSPSGLLTFDVSTDKPLPVIVLPHSVAFSETFAPTVSLSSDGKRIIVEEYEWKPLNGALPADHKTNPVYIYLTGRLMIYDADTGALVKGVDLSQAPGFTGGPLGFSPANDLMFFEGGDHLYIVDLKGNQATITINLPEGFDPVGIAFSAN